jgi:hypothetical protein
MGAVCGTASSANSVIKHERRVTASVVATRLVSDWLCRSLAEGYLGRGVRGCREVGRGAGRACPRYSARATVGGHVAMRSTLMTRTASDVFVGAEAIERSET